MADGAPVEGEADGDDVPGRVVDDDGGKFVGRPVPGSMGEVVPPRAPVPAIESTEAFEQIGRGTIAPLVARFLDAIRTGAPPSPSLADGLRAQVVLDTIATAAARGTWIDIPQLTA